MKNKIIALMLAGCIGLMYSCKKKETDTTASLDDQTKTFNDDGNRYKGESDQSNDDANSAIDAVPSFGRGVHMPSNLLSSPLCGVTIDSSMASQHILTLMFDSTTYCFSPSRIRAGKIKVQLTRGNFWGEINSQLTITYINFRVIYFVSNVAHNIVFNGVKTLDNVNGNDWLAFLAGTATLKYRERALNIQVDFESGTYHATWNSARLTQWTYNPSTVIITFSATGDTIVNGYSNVDSWGSNRYGQAFTTNYNTSIVSDTYCGVWRPNSGELVHHVNGNNYTLTLGVNPDGSPHTGTCGYGFKVSWTPAGGSPQSVVISY